MSEDSEQIVRKSPRWVKIVLTLSLALNLLIIGAVIGVFSRFGEHGRDWREEARKRPEGAMIVAFERADRRAMFDEVRRLRKEQGSGSARADLRAEVLAALRAVPFDPERLRGVMQARKSEATERHAAFETALIAKLSGMTDAARAAYADRFEKHMSRGRKRK